MSCRLTAVAALLALAPLLGQEPPLAPGGAPITEALARVRPSAREDAWRLLPWHRSLAAALALAKERDQPVFLFAYDGTLDDGNC